MFKIRFTIRHMLIVTGLVAVLVYLDHFATSRAQDLQDKLHRSPGEVLSWQPKVARDPYFSDVVLNDETSLVNRLCGQRRWAVTYQKSYTRLDMGHVTEWWATEIVISPFGYSKNNQNSAPVITMWN